MDYFFVFVVGFSVGVFARSFTYFGWGMIGFLILLALMSAALFVKSAARTYAAAAILIAAAALGAGRVLLAPQTLPSAFTPLIGTRVDLSGTIVADPDIRDTNQEVTISIEKSGQTTRMLAFAPLYPPLAYGERVNVSGEFEEPAPFATDGGRTFAYDAFLAKDGIFAIVSPATIAVTAPPSGFFTRAMGALYGVKHAFAKGIENALPEPSSALAEGLLTGGKQGLGKALLDVFTIAGIVQIVVLSGYNVMVVAEGILKALAFLPRRLAFALAGAGIIGFVLSAGAGASALRAGLMACLALYARATGRSYDALRALFLTLLIMLLVNPLSLAFDPSFELSFAATLGLIIGAPLIEVRLGRIKNAWLRDVTATTLSAQIFVLPLLLYETGNLSLVSVPANILVSLLVPSAMGFSFIAGLCGMLVPVIAPALAIPAYLLLSLIVEIATVSASLPLARITLPAFPFALCALAYLALWMLARRTRNAPRKAPFRISLRKPSS